ncbi:hypothetical protein [Acinetobacter pittii]|uniref:Uncharacterized protein n=1 Tax=Acinetobacter pittii ANC 4050 TaxID=1217691 RepID=R8YIW0_ACIPI|nr:hypothetical protein [Acinetobacter pittii]EOQ69011.1 hypothetical protein F931_01730 [Acinetobacter pittii ANC 4050]
MIIDIYRSKSNSEKFLSVLKDTDITTLSIPDNDYIEVTLFKSNKTIEADMPLIAMDPSNIIDQINSKGYALHSAAVKMETGIVK